MFARRREAKKGFTLVELSVVIVIIGVLAAFGVPKFRNAVERSKAGESFNYLSAIRSAQERYHSKQGTYTATLADLDMQVPTPKYFSVGAVTADETNWSLALTRTGNSAGYGAYTVVFTQDGYDSTNSTIESKPEINPMGS